MLVGKAGEHSVAAQLMVRGVNVCFPAVDDGVDLITENGCRIQVKSSHLAITPKMIALRGEGCYSFPIPKMKRIAMSDSKSRLRPMPKISEVVDVIVLWGIDQNRFWILPSKMGDEVSLFALGRENPVRYVGSPEALREMVSLGYTHEQIAAQYGISRSRVTVILNHPETCATKPSVASLARECENAWERILDFVPPPERNWRKWQSVEQIVTGEDNA